MGLEEKLCFLRKKCGLSQLEVAEALDVSRQAVSRWEVGAVVPTVDNLLGLSRLYGVTVDALIDGQPVDYKPPVLADAGETVPRAERAHGAHFRVFVSALALAAAVAVGFGLRPLIDRTPDETSSLPLDEAECEVIDISSMDNVEYFDMQGIETFGEGR